MNTGKTLILRHFTGFTLAELLIALVILGIMATFTIPKVLQSQTNEKRIAISKETIAMVSGAFHAYQQNNTVTPTTSIADLTPYMNYVRIDTTAAVDGMPSSLNGDCSAILCLRLHNGGLFATDPAMNFSEIIPYTDRMLVGIDADGKYTGNSDSLGIVLYSNGRITSAEEDPDLGNLNPTWWHWD